MAIIVPDEEELKKYAGKNNLSGSFKELCQLKVTIHLGLSPCLPISDYFNHVEWCQTVSSTKPPFRVVDF